MQLLDLFFLHGVACTLFARITAAGADEHRSAATSAGHECWPWVS